MFGRLIAVGLVSILCSVSAPVFAAIPIGERDALVALYTLTNGGMWYDKTNWLGGAETECTWFGVTCNGAGTTVTAISLFSNNLDGPLPAIIDSLPNLEYLNLGGNNLSGTIPTSVGNLASLLELDLGYGGGLITGQIPVALGDLSLLQHLDLSGQALSGPIPDSIMALANLDTLVLADNQLTGGIPASITGLSSLEFLNLDFNPLGGSIPAGLGTMTTIERIFLNWTGLVGEIPPELGGLPNLEYLSLSSNDLEGEIPSALGTLASLTTLNLGNNRLSGTIPPGLATAPALRYLFLWGNSLSGPIPPELGAMATLFYLDLSWNQLSGEIPAAFSGLTSIQTISLRDNQISGTIPAGLGSLPSLRNLTLSNNSLSGPLPGQLGSLSTLERLQIEGNKIAGAIPASFAGLTSLAPGNSDLRWNALYTDDPTLAAFLDTKQIGGNWQSSQTVAPGVAFRGTYPGAVVLDLDPIQFIDGVGGYELEMATAPGGPFSPAARVFDKTTDEIWAFFPDTSSDYYWHRARTWTGPHAANRNTVVSDWGDEQNFFISNTQFALYVDPAGLPGNDCLTPATPCPDIDSVFQGPHTGIRVFVAPGTYNENLTATRQVELVGADPATTIIDGGGLDRVFLHNYGPLSLKNLTIRNGAAIDGGGIQVVDTAVLSMENCVVENNSAEDGGGIHVAAGATLDLTAVEIRLNTAAGNGGGIRSGGGTWIDGCTIDGNQAGSPGGGGVSASQGGYLWMSETAVTGNICDGTGGGLENRGVASIEKSLFTGNDAGGAPAILNSSNTANMTLVNSTISGNTAQGYNSPTAFYATQPILMDSCTVTGNTGVGPEAAAIFGGNMTIRSSIVSGNTPVNCSEPLLSYGANIEDTDTCGLIAAGDQIGVDPLLDALTDNGGPTMTHALLVGSPAIDSGHPFVYPSTDQRGVARPDGGALAAGARSDTGAFEVDSVIFADGFESGDTSAWSP